MSIVKKQRKMSEKDKRRIRNKLRVLQNSRCAMCNARMRPGRKNFSTLDHVIPISKNGPDRYDNLVLLCNICNQNKGDTINTELVAFAKRIWKDQTDPSVTT
jgi:5-methylcytosine-specific restriction endonuclease McrA